MRKIFLLFIAITVWINAISQISRYKKEFSKIQTKQWIITSLNQSVLFERDSQIKPNVILNDTAIDFILKNYSTINKKPLSLHHIFKYSDLGYVMNTFVNDENFIFISRENDSGISFKINTRFLKEGNLGLFVQDLEIAFEKLKE